jgi:hypothetical protein
MWAPRLPGIARSSVGVAIVLLVAALVPPANAVTRIVADLRIVSVATNVRSGPVGTHVVFRVVAENAGPDVAEVAVDATDSVSAHTGEWGFDESVVNLHVTAMDCYWDAFGGTGPSPDTPACEFGFTPPGDTVFVRIGARIARHTPSNVAALAFFVADFDSDRDIDPSNDLAVARILITNG